MVTEKASQQNTGITDMKEPIATVSSAAFFVPAGYIALTSCGYELLVFALILLGCFSGAFHSSGSARRTLAHRGDEWSVYLVGAMLSYYSWNESIAILVLLTLGLAAAFLYLQEVNSFYVVGGLATFTIAGLFDTAEPIWILMVVLATAVSFGLRSIDNQTDLLHGAWHIAISYTIGLTWWVLT